MNKAYYQSSFLVDSSKIDEDKIQEIAYINNLRWSILENKDQKKDTLYIYGETQDEVMLAAGILSKIFSMKPESTEKIFENEYLTKYIENYKPFKIGKYNIIPYFHKDKKYKRGVNLIMNPGFSFGTGEHPTTKLVLLMMSEMELKGLTVLDCGCGSGILTIAAILSGAKRGVGFDIDDSILSSTKDNSKLNKVKNAEFIYGNINVLNQSTKYDLFLVNMLSHEFKTFFAELKKYGKKSSLLMVSGIMSEEKRDIEKYFSDSGFKIIKKKVYGSWLGYMLSF